MRRKRCSRLIRFGLLTMLMIGATIGDAMTAQPVGSGPIIESFSINPLFVRDWLLEFSARFTISLSDDNFTPTEAIVKLRGSGGTGVNLTLSANNGWSVQAGMTSFQIGIVTVTLVRTTNQNGDTRSYFTSDLAAAGFPTQLTYGDATPPELADFSINPAIVDISVSPAQVSFTSSLIDPDSPPNEARVEIRSPGGIPYYLHLNDINNWTSSLTVNEPGNWIVELVRTESASGAGRYYYTSDLAAEGFPTELTASADDTTPPTLNLPADITAEAVSPAGAVVTYQVSATDTLDPFPIVSCSPSSGSSFPMGSTTVNCTASDASGNSTSGSFTITVQDTSPPSLNMPADMILEATGAAGAIAIFRISLSDAGDPAPILSCSHQSGIVFPLGSTTVSCTATDSYSNSSSASFSITVQDTTPPVLSMPSAQTSEATGPSGTEIAFTVSAMDAVDASPVLSCNPSSGSNFLLGTTTVSCTATDGSGNSSTGSFSITVQDTSAPLLNLPANIIVEAAGPKGTSVNYTATASDYAGVDPSPAVSCIPSSSNTFPLGTTSVQCTATDFSGNSSSGSFVITVNDTTPPSLSLPANMILESTDQQGIAVSFSATAIDVVDSSPSVSCNPLSGDLFPLGTTTVLCTATDDSGNSVSGSFTVTVNDASPPPVQTSTLTVNGSGTGSGRVSGSGINCDLLPGGNLSGLCSITSSDLPLSLSLTASPESGSVFEGWTGCDSTSGTNDEICNLTLNVGDRLVTAAFQLEGPSPSLTIEASGEGAGTISGPGFNCTVNAGGTVSGTCSITASNPPLSIALAANPSIGSIFVGWTGCDSTSGANNENCNVTLNLVDRTVRVTFQPEAQILTLSVHGDGTGSGMITGSGISCNLSSGGNANGICSISTSELPSSIVLTATPSAGSIFAGWEGCDSVSGSNNEICHVTVNLVDRKVTASFNRESGLPMLRIEGSGTGSGSISGSGITCNIFPDGRAEGICTLAASNPPLHVILTARVSSASTFEGWSGCDSTSGENNEICSLTLDLIDRTLIAAFMAEEQEQPPEEEEEQPPEEESPDDGQIPQEMSCDPSQEIVIYLGHQVTGNCLYLGSGGDADTRAGERGVPPRESRGTGNGGALPSADGNRVPDYFMQFDLDDQVLFEGEPTQVVLIEFEYFDGVGPFSLQYDALPPAGPYGDGTWKREQREVSMKNTRTWKTAAFEIDDAYFGNRNNGYDFRISDNHEGWVDIHKVTVTLDAKDEDSCRSRTVATITLGWENIEDCLYLIRSDDADTEYVEVGDPPVEARRTGNGVSLPSPDGLEVPDYYMMFDLDDLVLVEGRPTSQVRIEIEYFDRGYDDIRLQYDARGQTGPTRDGRFTGTMAVHKTNSETWKTATFVLYDVYFGNRQYGLADFRLDDYERLRTGGDIIRKVTVTLIE